MTNNPYIPYNGKRKEQTSKENRRKRKTNRYAEEYIRRAKYCTTFADANALVDEACKELCTYIHIDSIKEAAYTAAAAAVGQRYRDYMAVAEACDNYAEARILFGIVADDEDISAARYERIKRAAHKAVYNALARQ